MKQLCISLSQIDSKDQAFRITSKSDTWMLLASIRQTRLIHPPVLQEKGEGTYRIVSGFLRVAACVELGWSQIPAHAASPDADEDMLAFLAVTENATQRGLDIMEQARAVKLLLKNQPMSLRLPLIQEALGTPVNQAYCQNLLKLHDLPALAQEAVASGVIGLASAMALAKMHQEDCLSLASVISDLRLGLNKQREVMTLASEIARLQNQAIHEVFSIPQVALILQDTETDRNQKAQLLRNALFCLRYPHVSAAHAAFESHVANLALPKNIRLAPPNDFEGDYFEITLRCKSLKDLQDKAAVLERLVVHPAMERIFKTES